MRFLKTAVSSLLTYFSFPVLLSPEPLSCAAQVAGKLKAKEFPGLCLNDQVLQEYSLSSFCPGRRTLVATGLHQTFPSQPFSNEVLPGARELSCDPAQVADCRLHWHGSYKVPLIKCIRLCSWS